MSQPTADRLFPVPSNAVGRSFLAQTGAGRHASGPREAADPRLDLAPDAADRLGASSEPRPLLRILLVEDDSLIGLLLGDVLTDMGHEICAIEATETGAVEAAARFMPDLMIVDAWLDEGSGVSAVRRILHAGFVPHIFVSGDRLENLPLDPAAVILRKPFFASELASAILRALAARPGTPPS
jgi:CheY-like chemotaxis protein